MTEGFPTVPLGDRNQDMIPFTRDTQLVGYLTLPKSLFHLGLSHGALLVYTLLLDRGKLSQRSGWTDKQGWVYVIYRVRDLAETLEKGMTTIKRWLRELEDRDLIFRTLPMRGEAGWIFLRVPAYSVAGERERPWACRPPSPSAGTPGRSRPGPPEAPRASRIATPARPRTWRGCGRRATASGFPHPRPNLTGGQPWRGVARIWTGVGPDLGLRIK